ncbi:MAG: Mov34/MPN/PAD-1 family protein [Candidatus Bathyarchaeia archaeon]
MFNVRISAETLKRIAAHTRRPYEQIGLLLGDLVNRELVIYGSVEGGGESNETMSAFSPQRMASLARQILSGRVQGSIVGWYHSHVRGGVFMSEVDIQTQLKLQQFSPYIVAMVLDTQANEFGIFTYSPVYGLVQIPDNQIIIY